jgi:hypothetical protein
MDNTISVRRADRIRASASKVAARAAAVLGLLATTKAAELKIVDVKAYAYLEHAG